MHQLNLILIIIYCFVTNAVAEQVISPKLLEKEVGVNLSKTAEFTFIREEAEKLGVKAYLFGGTAASFAHYVKWNSQFQNGDGRFQKERFDFDYTNIYHSSQDLDIVIDGTPSQAMELQQRLQEIFPHVQGTKTAWEVRLLRGEVNGKEALLGNADFYRQHTDSNSTGMIEITKPNKGDGIVRDLRDWESKQPYFLKDVAESRIHFYHSPEHHTTKRFKAGTNPPIESVIRYLIKMNQFNLEPYPEDLPKIRQIIDDFRPESVAKGSAVANWIEKNGKKLFQNAIDMEAAFNNLEKLGLRQKLIAIQNNPQEVNSLAWLLSKEPLRSKPLGNTGRTAAEVFKGLGITDPEKFIISHETNSYAAYESITKAHSGDANVFISRVGASGEGAAHGPGFYTRIGNVGAKGLTPEVAPQTQLRYSAADVDGEVKTTGDTSRNAPCPCGSGKKYKRCHGAA